MRRSRRKKWIQITVGALLVLLPWIIHLAYKRATALPRQITIATGPEGGRYEDLMKALADEVRSQLHIEVRMVDTSGSLDNLYGLEEGAADGTLDSQGNRVEGKIDFALYQPGTLEASTRTPRLKPEDVRFVANLYSQPVHFLVRHDSGITRPEQLRGKRVAVGLLKSGDYAMSRMLLEHFGLDAEDAIQPQWLTYKEIGEGFDDGSLDAAFITVGVQAPVFGDLLATGAEPRCHLLEIPCVNAFVERQISASEFTIHEGFYQSCPTAIPPSDIKTVAFGAQLLTHDGVDSDLVHEVARLITSERFVKENALKELFTKGRAFAEERPEFPMHDGARSYYDPDFDIHLFESLDAIYSLTASFLIAIFVVGRWANEKRIRRKEHRLDRHILDLLEIERRQIELDGAGRLTDDLPALQGLLDEVTQLRQAALAQISARELNEDRAVDCFIEMCHALSNKINAKISRQRMDARFRELIESLAAVKSDEGKGT